MAQAVVPAKVMVLRCLLVYGQARGSGQINGGVRVISLECKAVLCQCPADGAHLRTSILREGTIKDPFLVVNVAAAGITGDAEILLVSQPRYTSPSVRRT